jgi:hypothetical protein
MDDIDDEWVQTSVLPSGSVLALYAPDDSCWLAVTCSDVAVTSVRWTVRWLARVPEQRKKAKHGHGHPCFCIDPLWNEATVWRDCVVADISRNTTLDENSHWLIPQTCLDRLEQLIDGQKEQEDMKCEPEHTISVPTSIADDPVSEATFSDIIIKCADALKMVM